MFYLFNAVKCMAEDFHVGADRYSSDVDAHSVVGFLSDYIECSWGIYLSPDA